MTTYMLGGRLMRPLSFLRALNACLVAVSTMLVALVIELDGVTDEPDLCCHGAVQVVDQLVQLTDTDDLVF